MVKMTFHVMIIPTLNCPSNCKYCWGSENKKEMMDLEIIDQICDFLQVMTSMSILWKSYPNCQTSKDFPFKAISGF